MDKKEENKVLIRPAYRSEWKEAMDIAWKTFLKFEKKDYTAQVIKSFYQFITDPILEKMFYMGEYQLFGAYENKKMIGMAGIRNRTHISLLFVDEQFHKKGVGRKLMQYIFHYSTTEMGEQKLTVNAAPYAVGFYHRIGFHDTDRERDAGGIRYTPMIIEL